MRLLSLLSVLAFAGLSFVSTVANALKFEPSIGVAAEYTDNAKLSPDNTINDVISIGYVGARLSENDGSLSYDATTSFTNNSYTQDSYQDKRYFNLAARANWEMVKERFDWMLSNNFNQTTINSFNVDTPDNLQDTNAFTLGANIKFPLSARQNFSIGPSFSQYYYEAQATDNKQLSLSANWNYQFLRLTMVGLSITSRDVHYTENDQSGSPIADTTFTNAAFIVSGKRISSNYSLNVGATNVQREGYVDTLGFAGNLNWLVELSSRSKFNALLSTDLTDTSSIATGAVQDPVNGNQDDVQVSTDVVRNTLANLAYIRDDEALKSRLWASYRETSYSDSPLDQIAKNVGIQLNYPVTQLLSSGYYLTYNHSKQLDTSRIDERYTIGGNLRYNFNRKWHSLFDIRYRTKDSTDVVQNYDEFTIYASFVYGYGEVSRPSRSGN